MYSIRIGIAFLVSVLTISLQAQELILDPIATYSTGIFDESAAEIVAHDPGTQRLFFINADAGTVDVLDIMDPSNPTLINTLDVSEYGDGANSVDVRNGIVAVAVEADPSTDPGQIVFFDADGNFLNAVQAGALPDALRFSPDGTKVVVANEGEPNDDYDVDPEGSITIIDISSGAENATATQLSFEAFNDKKMSLINRGIRIFGPNATVAQDLEPEFVTISEDNSTAYVTLQENNALAVVDIAGAEIVDILPLGYKDHSKGAPMLREAFLNELPGWPSLGTPAFEGGEPVQLGGFSGLYFDPTQSTADEYVFYTIPDRGPNESTVSRADAGTSQNLRPFKLPNYQARIVKFTYNVSSQSLSFDEGEQIFLNRQDGETPISGRGNIPGFDEVPVTRTDATEFPNVDYSVNGVDYHALPYDEFGGDFEGILRDPSGDFWMCDEYRPAIYHFNEDGTLIERYVPEGTSMLGDEAQPAGTYGAETLPAVYAKRRANRGFEALALDTDTGILYAFIQTPMYNPNSSTRNNSDVIRVLGINPADGTPVAEYVYLLERNADSGVGLSRVDKIGDAVYVGNGRFLILERDSSTPDDGNTGKKYVFEFNLKGATNILGTDISLATEENTLEQQSADDLAALGIRPVYKRKVLNLPSIGYLPSDKPEGLAYIAETNTIAVLNDNDFGLAGAGVSDASDLGLITFKNNYGFDASNRDDDIEIWPRPTYGMFQPDAIDTYTVNGKAYIVSANEGDARDYDGFSEEVRVDDLALDEEIFPAVVAEKLQDETNLGRLRTSDASGTASGDIDGDGDIDEIRSYGARSFSIWDENGNLVFDSGDEFEKVLQSIDPENFNANNDDNDSFKARSDDKGPEPEAIEIAEIDGRFYCFIGLERVGGVVTYDVTDPMNPVLVDYVNNRNFDADPESVESLDLGVEDIIYIAPEDSPTGKSLVVTSNEVSGTVTIFGAFTASDRFSLQVLHNNDGESQLVNAGEGLEFLGGIARFKTVADSLRYAGYTAGNYTLMLSSGDNFIPSPEFNANLDRPEGAPLYDAIALKALNYDAIALGNHDFDFGTDILEELIIDVEDTDATPTFLSANLDFTNEPGLNALVGEGKIAPSTILYRGAERVGVIGLTTPNLPFISNPGNTIVNSDLAGILQTEIDALEAQGVNKIILVSHLQSINEEIELIEAVDGLDIVIAGGGDELLSNNPQDTLPGVSIDGPYPVEATDAAGRTVYVVTTPGEYRYIGQLFTIFDEEGEVIRVGNNSGPVKIVTNRPNAELQASVVDPIVAHIAGLAANILATTEVDLDGIRGNVRTVETNQGNLIADALLWQANQIAADFGVGTPDVALQNGGGIRNNNIIAAGSEISELTTFDILPFTNFVSVLEDIPADQFKDILENAVSRIEDVSGRFAQVAGFSFVYDPDGTPRSVADDGTVTPGARVMTVTLDDGTVLVEGGEVVADAPTVTVATINFLANGGDQYPFNDVPFTSLGVTYQEALANYLVDGVSGTVAAADYPEGGEGRITTVPMALRPEDLVNQTIADNLNELLFGQVDLTAYPNPTADELNVLYQLKEAANLEIFVTDLAGKRIATLFQGNQDAGQYQLPVSTKGLNLSAGTYMLSLRAGNAFKTLPIITK